MSDPARDPRERHRAAFLRRLPGEIEKVTWPLQRLLELRDTRLRGLIRHAREHSPWHRKRLVDVDVDGLTGEDMSALPTMTKADLMDNWDAISCDPATESGELGISNPLAPDGSPAMHRLEDANVAEFVDGGGKPVPPGIRAADVLVTNVLNQTLPIIRYRLGDSPTLLPGNPGPWTGRRIAPIEGREYRPFVYPNGDVLQLHAIGLVLREEARVLEFRVRQTPDGIDVEVLLERPIDLAALRRGVIAAVERAGLHSPTVTIRAAASIPRNPLTGKVQMFVPLAGGA